MSKQVISESWQFGSMVIGCIILAGVLVGVQTYKELETDPTLNSMGLFVQIIFTIDVLVKVIAEGPRPWRFW
jgi:hypothetical protein